MPANPQPPRELVHALQDAMEKHFGKAFQRYVLGLRNSPTLAHSAARARDVEDTDTLMEHFNPFIDRLGEERRRMSVHAAALTRKELNGKLMRKADGETDGADLGAGDLTSAVGLSFEADLADAAALMQDAPLDFIVEFTATQREAVRRALVAALRTGKGTQSVARTIRNSIGLTAAQQDAVDSYQALLEAGSAQALDRVLRDARFDAGLESALATGEPLSASRIATMVDRYAQRYLAYRAETIARTETTRVLNEARQQTTEQVVDQAGFAPDEVVRTWSATMDKRTRDTHAAMDGQERGLYEPFDSPSGVQLMYPGDPEAPAEEVINCRCSVLISFKSGASAAEVVANEVG